MTFAISYPTRQVVQIKPFQGISSSQFNLAEEVNRTMANDEKMWYSLKEAAEYLHIDQSVLQRKLMGLNVGTRTLPGEKGEFLSRRDVIDIERMIRGPRLAP